MQDLVLNYAQEGDQLKPDMLQLDAFVRYSCPDTTCRWKDQGGQHCDTNIGEHVEGSTFETHAAPSDTVCHWDGCHYKIPPTDVANQKGLMALHVALQHLRAIPLCPLCACNLNQPPHLPAKRLPYSLAEHFTSGWCVGLANCAVEYGKPVIAPNTTLKEHRLYNV
ncbi:hypothetical protein BD626DRAFT_508411 [Schizophyllum amplum]|uniref:Uncharacterized protein n=1 Tax=Schizophyllum amplum TaxID=97359 RepID=A0A550C3U8_9AGAR|nr:hypothetical protein BD626DRAFT_508411 [Auriculariopsis ampla]